MSGGGWFSVSLQEPDDLPNVPKMGGHPGRHCRGHPQSLMNPGEIVVHVVQGNRRLMVRQFL